MNVTDILSVGALMVSGSALFISWQNWRTSNYAARNDIIAQVRLWCERVVDLFSDASELCAKWIPGTSEASFVEHRSRVEIRTAALIDSGRLFFPNYAQESYGLHKSAERRGIRPPILDLLVLSLALTRAIESTLDTPDSRRRRAFAHLRRVFVFTIQGATGSSAPSTVTQYENYLWSVKVAPLPAEIKDLQGAAVHQYQLTFDPNVSIFSDY